MTQGGGTWAAFDGNPVKRFAESANLAVSLVGYNNWVGKDWGGGTLLTADTSFFRADSMTISADATGTNLTVQRYSVQRFTMTAPRDTSFSTPGLPLNYIFQGSSDAATWVNLAAGVTAGETWESITVPVNSSTLYQYHRLVFDGNGVTPIAVAQLAIDTGNRGTGAEGVL